MIQLAVFAIGAALIIAAIFAYEFGYRTGESRVLTAPSYNRLVKDSARADAYVSALNDIAFDSSAGDPRTIAQAILKAVG